MTEAIQQSVEFRVAPDVLYEMYMDSKKHSQATGAAFTAFGGELLGKNLLILPKKMIVQSWRAAHWKKSDPDSILVLTFSKTKSGGRVDLVHVNVPEHDHQGVTQGWETYYWKPWRAYLARG
ncbi:MAG TPA: SRPBCC domain-containing protein [Terriglobales bacterium]|jgi:activator of HSP90 ATPase